MGLSDDCIGPNKDVDGHFVYACALCIVSRVVVKPGTKNETRKMKKCRDTGMDGALFSMRKKLYTPQNLASRRWGDGWRILAIWHPCHRMSRYLRVKFPSIPTTNWVTRHVHLISAYTHIVHHKFILVHPGARVFTILVPVAEPGYGPVLPSPWLCEATQHCGRAARQLKSRCPVQKLLFSENSEKI